MASASLTVKPNGREIRKYGGTRGSVRWLYSQYKDMELEEFLCRHKGLSEDDYRTLELMTKFNKS